MEIIKKITILVLCISWILITSYKYEPLNSPGALLTYKSGLLSISNKELNIVQNNKSFKSQIYIDNTGVPHIYGKSDNDVAFGLGYMHAKDRYFQMEMITRTVQGALSEVLAGRTLTSDSFWRPYEFEKKSVELLKEYKIKNPGVYNYLVAYSKGVNYCLQNNINGDPLYTILGERPRQWKPEYSLLVTWYMSWSLSYFDHHIDQQEIAAKLPASVIDYFYPLQPDGINTILPSEKRKRVNKKEELQPVQANRGADSERTSPFQFHKGIGSNNWVLNGSKTKYGNPILANDPHLFLTLPEAFYEVQMDSYTSKVYGFSIPGVPVILSGHNNIISWGVTNGEWDLTDRYQLKVKNDSLYFYDGRWVPFEKKTYHIKIKGRDDSVIRINNTVFGKVLKEKNGIYYAQHWYAADKSNSVKAMYEVMHSKNWNEFKDALREYAYPPQNFIYSDINDNIGIVCAGKLPDRGGDYIGGLLNGTVKYQPKPAMDTLWYSWNPNKKFLFSANQQPIQNDVYFGYHGTEDDYRANRISSLLEGKNNWKPEEVRKMQSDGVDISFFAFKDLLNKFVVPVAHKKIADKLKHWDGMMEKGSNQALIYEALRRSTEFEAESFAKKYLKVNHAPSFKYFLNYLKDDRYTVLNSPSKQQLFNNILDSTDLVLRKNYGKGWETARYSSISKFTVQNISFIPGLGQMIDGVSGNTNTINMNTRYFHPVFRSVYEMQKGNIKGYTIMAGGQSGKINSKHYKDQLPDWIEGRYKLTQAEEIPGNLKRIENSIIFK